MIRVGGPLLLNLPDHFYQILAVHEPNSMALSVSSRRIGECNGTNANTAMISSGHAETYYDFRSTSEFGSKAWTGCSSPSPSGACDPAYPDVCIPLPPPDLDRGDLPYRNFRVFPPDPHHFDGDRDGIGCENG